jgi:hypothetical protein
MADASLDDVTIAEVAANFASLCRGLDNHEGFKLVKILL